MKTNACVIDVYQVGVGATGVDSNAAGHIGPRISIAGDASPIFGTLSRRANQATIDEEAPMVVSFR